MIVYKAMYKVLNEGVHGEVLDFPGVITCGPNLEETRRLLASALADMAETNLLYGESLPRPDPNSTDPDADLEEPIYLKTKKTRHAGAMVARFVPKLNEEVLPCLTEKILTPLKWHSRSSTWPCSTWT